MKILSVRQPWAWLICHGYKDVENRSWGTRLRGTFLVHAALTFDKAGYIWVQQNFPEIPLPAPSSFDLGGVVGKADIEDCVPPGSEHTGRCASRWYMGEYGHILANGHPIPFQPLKGRLGFFDAPPSITVT